MFLKGLSKAKKKERMKERNKDRKKERKKKRKREVKKEVTDCCIPPREMHSISSWGPIVFTYVLFWVREVILHFKNL